MPDHRQLPLAGPEETIDMLAARYDIPLLEVAGVHHAAVRSALESAHADVFLVSCFPWRLPRSVTSIVEGRALNLHPSMLPRHRGPDPLFWVYRDDDRISGVTIHRLTEQLDAGPIVGQERFLVPRGLPGDKLERQAAELGAKLLVGAVSDLLAGSSTSSDQDELAATSESWPGEADLAIPPDWSAERIEHFVRGVIPLGYRPIVVDGDQEYRVRAAIGLNPGERLARPVVVDRDVIRVSRPDGVVSLRLDTGWGA